MAGINFPNFHTTGMPVRGSVATAMPAPGAAPMNAESPNLNALYAGDPQGSMGGLSNQILGQMLMMMSMMLQLLSQMLMGSSGNTPGESGGYGDGAIGDEVGVPPNGTNPVDNTGGSDSTNSTEETPNTGSAPPESTSNPVDTTPPPGKSVSVKGFSRTGKVNWAAAPAGLKQYQKEIQSASQKTGMPESVLAAMVWQESRGNLNAGTINGGNGGHDVGLMQVNNETYRTEIAGKYGLPMTDKTPTDPANNILAGAVYLKQQKDKAKFSQWPFALRAYNSGPDGVDLTNHKNRPRGTGDPVYIEKVQEHCLNLENGTPVAP